MPLLELVICSNCGQEVQVRYDSRGMLESYGHVAFDEREGFQFEKFTCRQSAARRRELQALKTAPVPSVDCRYGDHSVCRGEEPAIWPDGDQTVRACSCACHTEAVAAVA